MAHVLGLNAKLYRNTATYATPTWDLVTNVKDLTLGLEAGEADLSSRASAGWRERAPTLRDAVVDWGMIWDNTDADFQIFLDAFTAGAAVGIAVMDGAIATTGSEGLRAMVGVFGFTRE